VIRGLVIAAALLMTAVAPAAADEPDLIGKRMELAERGGRLTVSTAFTEVFTAEAYDELGSGLANTVVIRVYVYRKGVELPVAFTLAAFRIVYDLWDELYLVRIDTTAGRQNLRFESRAEALRAITELDRFPIADLDDIAVGPHYFLALVVELNPVSEEMLAEMRRWLTRPAGAASLDRSTSFFGSFVSVFVNPKLPEADRVVRIRSQPFYRVAP
jgi:hypothetical protein